VFAREGAEWAGRPHTPEGLEELDGEIRTMTARPAWVRVDIREFEAIDRLGYAVSNAMAGM